MTRVDPSAPRHRQMTLSDGSQTFSVGPRNKLFKIPRALIEIHVEGENELNTPGDADEPILLSDSEEAFAAFYDTIMIPFRSCLFQANPDLSDVLSVLSLAHKYSVADIEAQARPLAINMTRPDVITRHLTPQLPSTRVAEIGKEVGCDEIVKSAWDAVMNEFRARQRPIHKVLAFADRICTPELAVLAYYEAMLRGPGVWDTDPLITDAHKLALGAGTARCAAALDSSTMQWLCGSQEHFSHDCGPVPISDLESACPHRREFVSSFAIGCLSSSIPSYDILGRLKVAKDLVRPTPSFTKLKKGGKKFSKVDPINTPKSMAASFYPVEPPAPSPAPLEFEELRPAEPWPRPDSPLTPLTPPQPWRLVAQRLVQDALNDAELNLKYYFGLVLLTEDVQVQLED